MGTVVHQVPQTPVVAGRNQSPLSDHKHSGADPGDLVEHMARNQQALAAIAEVMKKADHAVALNRIKTGERFIEGSTGRGR